MWQFRKEKNGKEKENAVHQKRKREKDRKCISLKEGKNTYHHVLNAGPIARGGLTTLRPLRHTQLLLRAGCHVTFDWGNKVTGGGEGVRERGREGAKRRERAIEERGVDDARDDSGRRDRKVHMSWSLT